MPFDKLNIADWITHQVELDGIADPTTKTRIRQKCLALAAATGQSTEGVAFAREPILFWCGLTRGERRVTVANPPYQPDDPRGIVHNIPPVEDRRKLYHPALLKLFEDQGIPWAEELFCMRPEELAFRAAGGEVPKGWAIRHVYNTPPRDDPNFKPNLIFDGKETSIWADSNGDHFTQSAGLVAVHPDWEADLYAYPCLVKALRLAVWQRFGYDPDAYFELELAHDRFGFVVRG